MNWAFLPSILSHCVESPCPFTEIVGSSHAFALCCILNYEHCNTKNKNIKNIIKYNNINKQESVSIEGKKHYISIRQKKNKNGDTGANSIVSTVKGENWAKISKILTLFFTMFLTMFFISCMTLSLILPSVGFINAVPPVL